MLAPLTSSDARALLSPSARVLVACALDDGGLSLVEQLPWPDLHWPTLMSLASFERAELQLYPVLRSAPPGAVPDAVLDTAQRVSRIASFRAAELADAAAAAVDALDANGITVLWLKGAALAMQHPAGFSVRGMGDLDLLVDPAQLEAARLALRAAGWADGEAPDAYLSHHHDAPMVRRGGLRLELHSSLFIPGHPFAPESASVWLSRAKRIDWGARAVHVLPATWHVVHASIHWAWSHEGEVGSWQYLHDMQLLTSSWEPGGPEWQAVQRHAELLGAARPVGWALWTAARLAGVPIDDATLDRLRPRPELGRGLTEREWVLRAFMSPASSPSVSWSRFWWRRAMAGLGRSGGAWPWALGHGAVEPSPAEERSGSPSRPLTREKLARWRRHLARVFGS